MSRYQPDFEAFTRLAAEGDLVPVYRQLLSDTLTPVSAFCQLQSGGYGFLFESVVGGERIGRYSFLGSEPIARIEAYGTHVVITRHQKSEVFESTDPLAELERMLADYRAVTVRGLPRFCGGAVGYAGYDTVRYVENLPHAPPDDRKLPDLSFAFYDRMVIFDQINKTRSKSWLTPTPNRAT